MIATPIKLFLKRNRCTTRGLARRSGRIEIIPRWDCACTNRFRKICRQASGFDVESARQVARAFPSDWEMLDISCIKNKTAIPVLALEASPDSAAALVRHDLFHPEASNRRIEQTQQIEVIAFVRVN